MKPGPAPEDDLIAATLQERVADDINSKVATTLMTVLNMVGEAVEHFSGAATFCDQLGIVLSCTTP